MKEEVIGIFQTQIEKLYNEAKEMLLNKASYSASQVDFDNVHLFLTFIESSLEKPYNRLCALSVFVTDAERTRADLMYPFASLFKGQK